MFHVEQLREIIKTRLEKLKQDIQAEMQSQRINASGRTSASLQVVEDDYTISLIKTAGDNAPLKTLEIGRPAGNVPHNFTDILYKWSLDKGINVEDRRSFAYLLGRRIKKKGTLRHFNNQNDVYSTLTDECAEEIKNMIGVRINEIIINNFKK